jgi:hypothetical protein
MEDLKVELARFLKYIKEVHTDKYVHLEVCDDGDHLYPTIENVVKEYLKTK